MSETIEEDVQTRLLLERVRDVAGRIVYREGYQWAAGVDRDRVWIELQHWREDAFNPGVLAWGSGGRRFLSPTMTDGEILRVALGAALAYEEHEVREFFRYRRSEEEQARAIFGPHIDVDALWYVANSLEHR